MTSNDFIAKSHWDKWMEVRRYVEEFDPDELVERLCVARKVRHVLEETRLTTHAADLILRKVKYPIPFRKSDFPRYRDAVRANRARYYAYLEATAGLREVLANALEELDRSYDKVDEVFE